jgi:hypothetical protein
MGLIDKLQQGDSNLTPFNGSTPPTNQLATAQSKMHDSYSVTGQNANIVNSEYQQYLDGTNNILPLPSQLDLNGATPTLSPSGQALPYSLNQPQ